jgi:ribosomal protein S14
MSPSFSFIKPVSPRKAKKSKSQPISPFAHQPFRPSALSRRPFAHHLSRRPFRAAAPESNIPESHIPKATYPKRQYRRETIASQQKAGYAIATINDGLLPTGS